MECALHSVSVSVSSFKNSSSPASNSFALPSSRSFRPPPLRLLRHLSFQPRTPLHASASASQSQIPQSSARWILLPVGDGDWKHIGSKVEMPDAFEIVSSEVTVGRLPDKADIVIPVATVSGLHARIKNQQDRLLITDLDSTNGTFINDKRLNPGVVAAVSSGNCITFGDIHLAMFQVSKLKTVEAATKLQESAEPTNNSELETS
ncbi:zeaxanthin epoxidase, chloroplastic [Momordica charantia]|uniref:Zeaxanthin epoxidase, chloroplastic n=1 Tax=Momordica charantia TaxID=3673 RepID=A0A6J1DLL4_MOMCH|nr:zeaxanthin epoxidase, chloroplastic [Momordica charantia]